MATIKENTGATAGFKVSSDLSAKKYYAVKLSSGALTTTHTKGNNALGVLIEGVDGSTHDKNGTVQYMGIARGKAGGTISEMDDVTVDTDGTIIATDTANQSVFGIALESAVDGDIIGILLGGGETTTS
jgi:hypothetical protein